MARFIFVTGGVASSLGKGMASSCLGALLQAQGYKVRNRKLDPYLNVDPGIISPYQHGEVFVTDDGAETDLDLGHYERFTGVSLRKTDTTTTGKIYADVIAKEKRGYYKGGTIQIIPTITDATKEFMTSNIKDEDFVICEIGGTVGDIESQSFIEAARQLENELEIKPMFIHLTLVPYIASADEIKTKPTQHSVRDLLSMGIQADILLCRSEKMISEAERKKMALFCNVEEENVIQNLDTSFIYELPLQLHKYGLDIQVLKFFGLPYKENPDLSKWEQVSKSYHNPQHTATIAVVGKYVSMLETYKSLSEAIMHAAIANETKVTINWVDAESITKEGAGKYLKNVDAVIVPGGFGTRGMSGKRDAITYAREHKIPMLGIGVGMQMALVDLARNVIGIADADSTEINPDTPNPVVSLLKDLVKKEIVFCELKDDKIRIGARDIAVDEDSLLYDAYKKKLVQERHRHRYSFNPMYQEQFLKAGIIFSAYSEDGEIPEAVELPKSKHPFFVGVLYQPEFKSRVFAPHPLMVALIKAAITNK